MKKHDSKSRNAELRSATKAIREASLVSESKIHNAKERPQGCSAIRWRMELSRRANARSYPPARMRGIKVEY